MTQRQKEKVPELRFPEFEGEWSEDLFGNLLKINQGLQIAIKDRLLAQEPNSLFYITNEFLREDSSVEYYIREPSESVVCCNHDILMTRTGNTGKVVTGVSGAFHNNFFKIQYPKNVAKGFLVEFLRMNQTQNLILRYAGSSTIPDLNHSDFYRIKFVHPEYKEQQKIASFFASLDKKIELLERKKELLEDYKKGCIQKIFSQEIRFKDKNGNDYPDWKEKKLGNIYRYVPTNSYSRDRLTYDGGEVLNIHYGDIHTKFRCLFTASKENVPFLKEDVNIEKIKETSYLKPRDLIVADASENYDEIGKTIEILSCDSYKIVSGLHTYILRPSSDKVSQGFGAYMMQSRSVRLQVMRVAQGTKVLGLPKSYLALVKLNMPQPEEQTKIANFLIKIDSKIEQVSDEIKQAQIFKKGLLQKMFV